MILPFLSEHNHHCQKEICPLQPVSLWCISQHPQRLAFSLSIFHFQVLITFYLPLFVKFVSGHQFLKLSFVFLHRRLLSSFLLLGSNQFLSPLSFDWFVICRNSWWNVRLKNNHMTNGNCSFTKLFDSFNNIFSNSIHYLIKHSAVYFVDPMFSTKILIPS